MTSTATITMAGIPDAGQPDASNPEDHGGKAEPQPMNPCPGLQSTPASSRENTSTATDGRPNIEHSPFGTAATPQRKSSSRYKVLQQSSIRTKKAPQSAGPQQRSLNTGRRGKTHLQHHAETQRCSQADACLMSLLDNTACTVLKCWQDLQQTSLKQLQMLRCCHPALGALQAGSTARGATAGSCANLNSQKTAGDTTYCWQILLP